MQVILSNRRWLRVYLIIRNSILVLTFAWLLITFTLPEFAASLGLFSSVVWSLLLVLILFDMLQKPGLFEVLRAGEGLLIKLYNPDTRYFFWLDEKRVRSINLEQDDQLQVYGQFEGLPWKKRIHLVIEKPSGQKFISDKLDISWASRTQFQKLIGLTKEFSA